MDILEKIDNLNEALSSAAWPTPRDVEAFLHQYVETALWSSTDESNESGGEPMDKNYDFHDMDHKTLEQMKQDCVNFMKAAGQDKIGSKLTNAAHDFWLTRNGHGAGFWDGDWDDKIGKVLTDLSHKFGEYDLYIGDDEKVHGGSF